VVLIDVDRVVVRGARVLFGGRGRFLDPFMKSAYWARSFCGSSACNPFIFPPKELPNRPWNRNSFDFCKNLVLGKSQWFKISPGITVYPELGKVWDRRVDKSGVTGLGSLGVKVWLVSKSIDLNWIDFVSREVVVEETEVVAGKDIVIGRIVVVSSKSKSSSGSSEINFNQSADNWPWRQRRCCNLYFKLVPINLIEWNEGAVAKLKIQKVLETSENYQNETFEIYFCLLKIS